jgi:hypothetical protein
LDIKDELLFWTGIMRDHANFHLDALAPNEQMYIEKSMYFMDFFKQIHEEIRGTDNLKPIYPKLFHILQCFIEHKRTILRNLLTCNIAINLPPTALSHQINEANQFMMVLSTPAPKHVDSNMKTMLFAEQLKQWISDSAGHAALMAAFLEPVEDLYIQQAMTFKMKFEKLTIKASELQMMIMYTGLEDGVLKHLGQETIQLLTEFICLCEKVKELRESCKIMAQGTFTPLVPDHFNREHQHWIMKIKEYK